VNETIDAEESDSTLFKKSRKKEDQNQLENNQPVNEKTDKAITS